MSLTWTASGLLYRAYSVRELPDSGWLSVSESGLLARAAVSFGLGWLGFL